MLDGIREPSTLNLVGVLATDRDDEELEGALALLETAVESATRLYHVATDGSDIEYLQLHGAAPMTIEPEGVNGSMLRVTVPLIPASTRWSTADADSGYSPDFGPDDLANLSLWLDASDAATVTSSGGAVSQWSDKSGNDRHATQASSDARPTTAARSLNGRNVLDFDGGDSLVASFAATLAQPYTAFVVVDVDSLLPMRQVFIDGIGTDNRGILGATGAGHQTVVNAWWAYCGGTGVDLFSAANSATLGAHVVVSIPNGSSSKIRADGAQVASGTLDTHSLTGVTIGRNFPGTITFNGGVAEVLIYSRALNTTELGNVEAYLAAKWGVTLS